MNLTTVMEVAWVANVGLAVLSAVISLYCCCGCHQMLRQMTRSARELDVLVSKAVADIRHTPSTRPGDTP